MRIIPTPIEPPEELPVSLADARLDCRLDSDDTSRDGLLADLIATATTMAQHELGRRLITQTVRVEFIDWPAPDEPILLSPFQSATVSYWSGSTWQALSASAFGVLVSDTGSSISIVQMPDATWPTLPEAIGPRVRVDVVCGYGDAAADVPPNVRSWIRAHVAAMLRTPEATTERAQTVLPYLSSLLDSERAWV